MRAIETFELKVNLFDTTYIAAKNVNNLNIFIIIRILNIFCRHGENPLLIKFKLSRSDD